MSGGGTETPVGCEAAPGGGGGGGKKKDSLGFAASPAHLIIRDLGEIHSRLLDHRPVIQGETRYFVKEFEEKRGLREMRVLENLKNVIHETNEHTLPTCRATVQGSLNQVLQRLQAATDTVCRLQQREQERKKEKSPVGQSLCLVTDLDLLEPQNWFLLLIINLSGCCPFEDHQHLYG
ncbi:biogenesis of lysosome-related organelles complex 1 subunit 5 isoform X2 [Budorcas taxicolor]|uniref:biogenesis of lysosome-related organelles complex 1 subunit 5 isoform X2 n=1 Tax=Budorcas taxicolor TaxID=37181 RepID=UPI002283598B|nr:biogenesis of lysosome-related organelles complex 1 subunit 5 isoform X2 [Budorcas taxicolor]